MNKFIVSGRLVKDPTSRELTVNGQKKIVANCSIAVRKVGRENETEFFELTFWNNGADYFAKNYHKGDGVVVYGVPTARAYQTQDGNIKASIGITINEIEKLSSAQPRNQEQPQAPTNTTPSDNSLPF